MATDAQRNLMKSKVIERELASRQKEQKKNEAFFNKIASGPLWRAFKIAAGVCILLAILFTIDTFVDGSSRTISENEFSFDRSEHAALFYQTVVIDGDSYFVPFTDLQGFDEGSFVVHKSLIFGDAKYITFNSSLGQGIKANRGLSIYQYFPGIQLLFLIPLGVIIYRRQSGAFYTIWGLTIFLIYPAALYLLLSRLV